MEKEDLIQAYFEKTLSIENQKKFNDLIETDASFAQEIAFQDNLKKAISLNERINLKKKLQQFEAERGSQKNFKWVYIAASIAVFVATFWFFNQSPDLQQLYSQYYQTYPNTIAPTVRGENSTNPKSAAFFEYDSGNFKKSHQLFLNIYNQEKQDYALFYSSLSLMELNKHNEALSLLNQFDVSTKSGFTPFVKWYKALCYMRLEKKSKAIFLLNELSKSKNPQQDKAKELLEKLE